MAAPMKPTQKSVALARMMPIITALAAAAYAVSAYFLLLMPKIGPLLEGGAADLAAHERRLADDERYLKDLQATVKSYQMWNPEQKERLVSIVTAEPRIPDIFVQVDAVARKHDLVLSSIDAVIDEKTVTPAGRKPVRIAANVAGGTYEQFKLFLADLERSDRLFDVRSLVFTPTSGSYGLVLHAYFLDPDHVLGPPATASTAAPAEPAEKTP